MVVLSLSVRINNRCVELETTATNYINYKKKDVIHFLSHPKVTKSTLESLRCSYLAKCDKSYF
jgi:hypothetical protein